MKKPKIVLALLSVLALTLVSFAGVVQAQDGGTKIAEGFNGPQGVLVDPEGNVWVIDSGLGGDTELKIADPESGQEITATFGDTARVVKVAPDGTQTVAATLPSLLMGQEAAGGARLALLDGSLYATSGVWQGAAGETAAPKMASVVKIEGGQAVEVASTWPLERDTNPDGFVLESHPYGVAAGPDGKLWVTDAGANDLLTVDPASGQVDLVAVFDGLPGPMANPARGGAQESDPVPTGIAFDQGGDMYVSFLPGAPFAPGSAQVVKVSSDGTVSDYATGLTTLTDLQIGPDGNLYAVQFGRFSEQGPQPGSGAIIRVKAGNASEVVVDGLVFPTSVAFDAAGDAYVTVNGVGAPGSGQVVKFTALTSLAGTPLSTSSSAPANLPVTGSAVPNAPWIALGAGIVLLAAGYLLRRGVIETRRS
jgi:sugar lactone lactonase YvrE